MRRLGCLLLLTFMNNNLNEPHKALLSLCHFVMFSQNTWNSNITNTCYSATYSERFFTLLFARYIKTYNKLCMSYYNNLTVTAESRRLYNNTEAFGIAHYFFYLRLSNFFYGFWVFIVYPSRRFAFIPWSVQLALAIFADDWTRRWNIIYWFL